MEVIILKLINGILLKNVLIVYVFFFISNVLQLVFPPFPSDVVLIFQGYLTSISSSFSFITVLLNAIAGTFLGSFLVYKFGFLKGELVFKYRLINKFIDTKHLNRAKGIFEKYGTYAIVVSKFVPGVNALIILLAGIFKMKSHIVYISILVSALIYHILVLLLGRYLGNNIGYVTKLISNYNRIVIAVLLVLLFGFLIYKYSLKNIINWKKHGKIN